MGNIVNTNDKLKPLREAIGNPVTYDLAMQFYNFVQGTRGYDCLGYLVLESELINNFMVQVSQGYYSSRDEIEQIAKLIVKTQKISRELNDPDEYLANIR